LSKKQKAAKEDDGGRARPCQPL